MITCRELVELLIDYVSDELSPEHRAHFESHLLRCPPCVAYVESYRLTIQLSRQLPCAPLPPELAQRLRSALEAMQQEQPPPEQREC
jgi:anti-sigma factor RsiW